MSYRNLGRVAATGYIRFEITIKIYRDCSPRSDGQPVVKFDDDISLGIYYGGNRSLYRSVDLPLIQETPVQPENSTGCDRLKNLCIREGIYKIIEAVPPSTDGYHLYYQRCCRNVQTNAEDDMGQGYYAFIPNTNDTTSSPDFPRIPAPFICSGDTSDVQNVTVDPDGDSVAYRLVWPLNGGDRNSPSPSPPSYLNNPLPAIAYKTGFSFGKPFGNNGICTIDNVTGLSKYYVQQAGKYAVSVEVREYRKGKLLGIVMRDVQLIVIDCDSNKAPQLSTNTSQRNYTVVEGDKLCFPVTFQDNGSQKVTIKAYGDPIDGTNGVKAPYATFTDNTGTGTASSQFCWQTNCEHGRSTPYFITVEAIDNGCPPKKTIINFFIQVNPYTLKVSIQGDSQVCLTNEPITYYIPPQPGYTYDWKINGGTIQTGQGTNSIQVQWSAPGAGRLIVYPKNTGGCEGDPDTLNVIIKPGVNKKPITGDTAVCEFAQGKVYSIPSVAGHKYRWIVAGGAPVSGINTATFTVNWGISGAGRVGVLETNTDGCTSDTMWLFVNIYKAKTSPIRGTPSVCPNVTGIEYIVDPTPGSTYFWVITGGTQVAGGNTANIRVNWGSKGNGRVAVVEAESHGCLGDTVYFPVKIDYELDGQFAAGDTVVCALSENVPYFVTYTNRSEYAWAVMGGSITAMSLLKDTVWVNWGLPGMGYVEVTETSYDSVFNLPCISLANRLDIRKSPLPSIRSISGPMSFCEAPDFKWFKTKGNAASKFYWFLDGNEIGDNSDSIDLVFPIAGQFLLSVVEVTEDSCVSSPIDTVIRVWPKPKTSAITGDTNVCYPDLQNHLYSVNGFGTSTFIWSTANGSIVSGQGTNNVVIDFNGLNPAWVNVVEISDRGCAGDTIRLNVFIDNPRLKLSYVTVGIQNDQVNEVHWELINAPKYNASFLIYRRPAGSILPFEVVGQTDSTARMFTDIRVRVNDSAYEYFVEGFNLCGNPFQTSIHQTILLKGEKVAGYDSRIWWTRYRGWITGAYPYDVMRRQSLSEPYVRYETQGLDTSAAYTNGFDSYTQCYRIKADENAGEMRSWSNKVCFNFDPVLWIPNAFTPNDDRLNDVFELKGGALKSFEISIYDRWGAKVFTSTKLTDSWDGTFRGEPSIPDVYMYIVKFHGYNNVLQSRTGTLHLIR